MDSLISPLLVAGLAALLIAFYAWGYLAEQKAKKHKENQRPKDEGF